jgi:hypothetical protein
MRREKLRAALTSDRGRNGGRCIAARIGPRPAEQRLHGHGALRHPGRLRNCYPKQGRPGSCSSCPHQVERRVTSPLG